LAERGDWLSLTTVPASAPALRTQTGG